MDTLPPDQGQLRLLLSVREAATAMGICEKTLWTLTQKGEIPVVRIGSAVRYSVDGLREWIQKKSEDSA